MPLYKVNVATDTHGSIVANTQLLEDFTNAHHGQFLGTDLGGDEADQDLVVVSLPEEAIGDLEKEPFVEDIVAPGTRSHTEVLSEPTYSGLN